MVDLTFKSRAQHFVPLALFKKIAALPTDEPPEDIAYIGEDGVRAVKGTLPLSAGFSSAKITDESKALMDIVLCRNAAHQSGALERPGSQ